MRTLAALSALLLVASLGGATLSASEKAPAQDVSKKDMKHSPDVQTPTQRWLDGRSLGDQD